MNVFAPTIDHYVVQANVKRRKKRAEKAVIYTEESASLETQSA
jgi:Na+-transporting NADH:ubiquinone oxidoreductase subunit B